MILDYTDIEIQKLPLHERSKLEQGLCPKCGNGRFITTAPEKDAVPGADDDVFVCIECRHILGCKSFRPRRAITQCEEETNQPDSQSGFTFEFDSSEKPSLKSATQPTVLAVFLLLVQVFLIVGLDISVPETSGTHVQAALPEMVESVHAVMDGEPDLPEENAYGGASPGEYLQEDSMQEDLQYESAQDEGLPEEPQPHETPSGSGAIAATVPTPPEIPLERNSPYNDEYKVMQMQQKLNDIGAYGNENLEIDGRFGPLTQAAVMYFQRLAGLYEDGIVNYELWIRLFMWELIQQQD